MSLDDLNRNTIDLDMQLFGQIEQVRFENWQMADMYDKAPSSNTSKKGLTFAQFKDVFAKLLAQAKAVPRIPHPITYYSFSPYCTGDFFADGVKYQFAVFLGYIGTITRPDGKYGYFQISLDSSDATIK